MVAGVTMDRAAVIVVRAKKVRGRPLGTAVAAVRKSTADRKQGLTISAQLGDALGYAASRVIRVGHVVISMENDRHPGLRRIC